MHLYIYETCYDSQCVIEYILTNSLEIVLYVNLKNCIMCNLHVCKQFFFKFSVDHI